MLFSITDVQQRREENMVIVLRSLFFKRRRKKKVEAAARSCVDVKWIFPLALFCLFYWSPMSLFSFLACHCSREQPEQKRKNHLSSVLPFVLFLLSWMGITKWGLWLLFTVASILSKRSGILGRSHQPVFPSPPPAILWTGGWENGCRTCPWTEKVAGWSLSVSGVGLKHSILMCAGWGAESSDSVTSTCRPSSGT